MRDYEERIDCSEAMIHVALGSLLLRRIGRVPIGGVAAAEQAACEARSP